MKKIIKIFPVLILLSCTQSVEEASDKIVATPARESVEIQQLFDSYEAITLKSDELIPNISSVIPLDSMLIVCDAYVTGSIYFFDLEGNYLNKWNNEQDEFFYLNEGIKDIKINPINGELCILSKSGSSISCFDLEGNHSNTHTLNFRAYSFVIDENGYYYFDLSNEIQEGVSHNLVKVLLEENEVKKIKPTPEENLNLTLTSDKTLTTVGGRIFYVPCLEQAIFEIVGDSAIEGYKIDYLSSSLSKDYLSSIKDSPPLMKELDSKEYAVFPRLFSSRKELVLNSQIGSLFNGYKHHLIINQDNNATINFSSLTLDSQNLSFNIVGQSDDGFILSIDPEQSLEKNSENEQYQALLNHFNGKTNLNPVLLLVKISWKE